MTSGCVPRGDTARPCFTVNALLLALCREATQIFCGPSWRIVGIFFENKFEKRPYKET
jgi:hypothetical protein